MKMFASFQRFKTFKLLKQFYKENKIEVDENLREIFEFCYKKKFIDWYASIIVVLGSFLGIELGSYLVTYNYVSEENTYKFLTLMLIITSVIFTKQYLL